MAKVVSRGMFHSHPASILILLPWIISLTNPALPMLWLWPSQALQRNLKATVLFQEKASDRRHRPTISPAMKNLREERDAVTVWLGVSVRMRMDARALQASSFP